MELIRLLINADWVWLALPAALLIPLLYLLTPMHRRRAMCRTAERMGFDFARRDASLSHAWFARFPLLARRGVRAIRNVMQGEYRGFHTIMFDLDAGIRHHRRVTVVAFQLERNRVPHFAMWPRGIGLDDLPARCRDGKQVSFKHEDERFDAAYEVDTPNPGAIRQLFKQRVLHRFARRDDWAVEGGGDWIVFYQLEPRIGEDVKDYLWHAYQALRPFELR